MLRSVLGAGNPALLALAIALAGVLIIPFLPYGESYAAERRAYREMEMLEPQYPSGSALPFIAEPHTPQQPAPAAPTPAPVVPAAGATLQQLVKETGHIEPANQSARCLVSAIYFEARGESLIGQLAVAEVVLNRVEDRKFASTVCGVIRQPYQFSFVKAGRIPDPPRGTRAWRRAVAIAYIAQMKLWKTNASRSLYYHADYVAPAWRHAFQQQARLGAHIFYR